MCHMSSHTITNKEHAMQSRYMFLTMYVFCPADMSLSGASQLSFEVRLVPACSTASSSTPQHQAVEQIQGKSSIQPCRASCCCRRQWRGTKKLTQPLQRCTGATAASAGCPCSTSAWACAVATPRVVSCECSAPCCLSSVFLSALHMSCCHDGACCAFVAMPANGGYRLCFSAAADLFVQLLLQAVQLTQPFLSVPTAAACVAPGEGGMSRTNQYLR